MDAAYGAASTGRMAQKGIVGKGFTSDTRNIWISGLLEISHRQSPELVENGHVNGCAQIVILIHHVGGGKLLVHFLEEVHVLFPLRQVEYTIALNRNGLEIFAPHNRTTAEPAEVTISIHSDTGIG